VTLVVLTVLENLLIRNSSRHTATGDIARRSLLTKCGAEPTHEDPRPRMGNFQVLRGNGVRRKSWQKSLGDPLEMGDWDLGPVTEDEKTPNKPMDWVTPASPPVMWSMKSRRSETTGKCSPSRNRQDPRQRLIDPGRDRRWPIMGGCWSCGALDTHAFQECVAKDVVCQRCGQRCGVMGHFTMFCRAEKTRHGKYGKSRNRRRKQGESTPRGLGRGRSCGPCRRDIVTTPMKRVDGEDMCKSVGDLGQVGKRKGVVAPLTQTHKGLPI
jgi:hypothetical protein